MQDINLAVCGHAGHGKSTLIGKAVTEMGMVTHKQLDLAREAAKAGKDPSYIFANLVFRSKKVKAASEAARGITYQTAIIRFNLDDRRITAIDTPGQADYTNNLFIGMFQADGALLLVSANNGIRPVTEQILRILVGFQIPLLGVSVTKMDRVDYSQDAYEIIVDDIRRKLDEFGVDHSKVVFFPTSAYESGRDIMESGEGVTEFRRIEWFKGPTFKQFMSELDFEKIRPATPMRAVVHPTDAYDNVPGIGKCITALVETGSITPGMKLVFEPVSTELDKQVTADVRSIELTRGHIGTPGIPIPEGRPRQLVGVALSRMSVDGGLRDIFKGRGIVIGSVEDPPSTAQSFIVELTVFDAKINVRVGEEWVMHAHLDHVTVSIEEIMAYRFQSESDWIDGQFDTISPGDWGRMRVTAHRPIALEQASVLPFLSRIVIRFGSKAVAFGTCVEILDSQVKAKA
jgi:elongation factor 1-alpha